MPLSSRKHALALAQSPVAGHVARYTRKQSWQCPGSGRLSDTPADWGRVRAPRPPVTMRRIADTGPVVHLHMNQRCSGG